MCMIYIYKGFSFRKYIQYDLKIFYIYLCIAYMYLLWETCFDSNSKKRFSKSATCSKVLCSVRVSPKNFSVSSMKNRSLLMLVVSKITSA